MKFIIHHYTLAVFPELIGLFGFALALNFDGQVDAVASLYRQLNGFVNFEMATQGN